MQVAQSFASKKEGRKISSHEKFRFNKLEELLEKAKQFKLDIPYSKDISKLKEEVQLKNARIPNRMAIHPMEGCDGELDGSPGELTFRRYERFAKGGAGILWFEATAVVPEGRGNPRQLLINKDNVGKFKELVQAALREGKKTNGEEYEPYNILQITHSGRYGKPIGDRGPTIAVNNPYLDKKEITNYHIITDEELEALEDKFVEAAQLAKEAGFDAVDVKACHRYLGSELLSAHTREGKYGGSFENRTRFLLNIVDKIREKLGDTIDITVRLNVYDAHPYPYGFGVSKDKGIEPDLEEPIKLIKELANRGVEMINVTAGNPYYNPHIGRPYDIGSYIPREHPLEAVSRFIELAKTISKEVPEIKVLATGFSWLRQFSPQIMAGALERDYCEFVGFGRQAFAYPDFARDIIHKDELDGKKVCISCSKCVELKSNGRKTGCVIRDREIYLKEYQDLIKEKPIKNTTRVADHL